jgi:hypothetical protein
VLERRRRNYVFFVVIVYVLFICSLSMQLKQRTFNNDGLSPEAGIICLSNTKSHRYLTLCSLHQTYNGGQSQEVQTLGMQHAWQRSEVNTIIRTKKFDRKRQSDT